MDIDARLAELERLIMTVESHDDEIRTSVVALGERLTALCRRAEIHCSTEDFRLEGYGYDDYTYGHLAVSGPNLYLASRSTEEDLHDSMSGIPEEHRTYRVSYPASWPVKWLRAAATAENVRALLDSVERNAKAVLDGRAAVANQVRHSAELRTASIEEALTAAANDVDVATIVRAWGMAQAEIHSNPAGAITAACTLVESTLKHLLHKLGEPLPNDQSIVPLYKAVAKKLRLLPGDASDMEVRGLLQGVSSIIQNVGAMRTKVGDAHGKGPQQRTGDFDEARLAVNLAGTVCTYLIRQLSNGARSGDGSAGSNAST